MPLAVEVPEGLPAARLLKEVGYTERTFARACADASPPLRLYPEVASALEHLAQRGIALGAVTNLPRWMARPMLATSGLAPLLRTVIDYGATSRRKPHPEPLLEACRRIGCAPEHTWYVGDDPKDAMAAAAAQMPFAWASWGYTATAPSTAQRELESPGEIRALHRGAGVKYVYKIYSKYDGFTPARIPDRMIGDSKTLRLGWKHYVDVVEPEDEVWVYFHGPHRFDNGVYAKGIAENVLYEERAVLVRVTQYRTDTPLTDSKLSARIASVVRTRNQQVFVPPKSLIRRPSAP